MAGFRKRHDNGRAFPVNGSGVNGSAFSATAAGDAARISAVSHSFTGEGVYPDTLSLRAADKFYFFKTMSSFLKAKTFADKVGGELYTQIDGTRDRVYAKGPHVVNRTGIYLVVRHGSGDGKQDKALFKKEGWSGGLDHEDDVDYVKRISRNPGGFRANNDVVIEYSAAPSSGKGAYVVTHSDGRHFAIFEDEAHKLMNMANDFDRALEYVNRRNKV